MSPPLEISKSEIKDKNNFFCEINSGIDTPQDDCSSYPILKVWNFIFSREFKWQVNPDCSLYTKPNFKAVSENTMERYVFYKTICLLHATYKTTKYLLPLLFVVVKTNVDYSVVSSFAVQDETRAAITEPLRIIKKRKSKWDPKCLIMNNCDEEIKPIGNIFPREYIYLKGIQILWI